MSIDLGGYSFEGPFTNTSELKDESGVYAILDKNNANYSVIDLGESGEIKTRIENHDRKDCWEKNKKGTITIWAHYVGKNDRETIEQHIRGKYKFPCGKI